MYPAVRQPLHLGDFLAEMERGMERFCLLQQSVYQFLSTANRQGGNVVDRLVRIQLGALPADLGQGIDDVSADAEQAELEDLKYPNRAGADDDRFDRDGWGG